MTRRLRKSLAMLVMGCAGVNAIGQDVAQGAMLYMRLANDTRSCVSCHGPDPGQNPNNILRAADNAGTLAKVMNTVSAMGFLSSQLTETDRVNVTAFLGNVVRINTPSSPVRVWPITMDFGSVPLGGLSARQFVRVTNPSAVLPFPISSITTSGTVAVLQNDCGPVLAPGGLCELGIQLQPDQAGLQRGAIAIASSSLAQPLHIAMSGYGVVGNTSQLVWQSELTQIRLDAQTGGAQVRRALTLFNPGPMPAVLGSTSITGPDASQFRILGGCASGAVLQAGTQCEIALGYTPNALPQSLAVLQVRSDQGNPAAVRLEGVASGPAPQTAAVDVLASSSGGGCSVGPPNTRGHDPVLWLMALFALGRTLIRRRNA